MDRIILHWSAGTHSVSALDRQHYHFIIDGGGAVHDGDHPPEANERPVAGKYAAHTLNCNTGSIGVSLAAMAGAVEAPFNQGRYPITDAQVEALVSLCARLCVRYGIAVTRKTVLSHAEVQPSLGIKQRGKWDIAWLPGMAKPGDPVAVGDRVRERIAAAMGSAQTITEPDEMPAVLSPAPAAPPTIRRGDVGSPVTEAQRRLRALGYDITPDSVFGRLTEAAVKEFQGKRGLGADGIVGPATWSRLLA
ncbi:MAG: N-acetylmuramoyl-L-alanine amidase [Paracoccus aminovorans]|nr:N-acetylmuramoyl-L-alanine amidase [Paracoccus aminovorans]